jgi:hypothetical protein
VGPRFPPFRRLVWPQHTSRSTSRDHKESPTCTFRLIYTQYSGDTGMIPSWYRDDTQALICLGFLVDGNRRSRRRRRRSWGARRDEVRVATRLTADTSAALQSDKTLLECNRQSHDVQAHHTRAERPRQTPSLITMYVPHSSLCSSPPWNSP